MAITGIRLDPLPAFNFYIALIDTSSTLAKVASAVSAVAGGGFSECSGLEGTLQVEDYQEGGQNSYVHKFPTRIMYANIVLRRGASLSEDLWNWHYKYVTGQGGRRDGLIILQDVGHIPLKVWSFTRGLPLKWTGPSLNAAQSGAAIESLEITHEGLQLVSPGTVAASVGNAVASAL
jgi:phage tail-like protein